MGNFRKNQNYTLRSIISNRIRFLVEHRLFFLLSQWFCWITTENDTYFRSDSVRNQTERKKKTNEFHALQYPLNAYTILIDRMSQPKWWLIEILNSAAEVHRRCCNFRKSQHRNRSCIAQCVTVRSILFYLFGFHLDVVFFSTEFCQSP